MAGWETRKPSDAEGLFSEFQLGHGGVSSAQLRNRPLAAN